MVQPAPGRTSPQVRQPDWTLFAASRQEDGLTILRCSQNCKSRGSQRYAGKARLAIAYVEGPVFSRT